MGSPGAYLVVGRSEHGVRPAAEAVLDYGDFKAVCACAKDSASSSSTESSTSTAHPSALNSCSFPS